MRNPKARATPSGRSAKPTPAYEDEVEIGFIERQEAYLASLRPANFSLTPVTESAW